MLILRVLLILLGAGKNLAEPGWTYDFVSVQIENKTPEKVMIEGEITRPRRGVFAFSGTFDFKIDATDQNYIRAESFYSLSGSNFVRSPNTKLSTFMNSIYKDLAMESLLACGENVPRIVDKFVAPLTKRVMRFKDCIISTKNLPSKLKNGYYKIKFWYTNDCEGSLEFVIKVEQN